VILSEIFLLILCQIIFSSIFLLCDFRRYFWRIFVRGSIRRFWDVCVRISLWGSSWNQISDKRYEWYFDLNKICMSIHYILIDEQSYNWINNSCNFSIGSKGVVQLERKPKIEKGWRTQEHITYAWILKNGGIFEGFCARLDSSILRCFCSNFFVGIIDRCWRTELATREGGVNRSW
jgi:hypothetical protein